MPGFTRTSSSGGLLELDRVRILLDGVSLPTAEFPDAPAYSYTPPDIIAWLACQPVSAAAFTHSHPDHFSPELARRLKNAIILGPEDVADALPDRMVLPDELSISGIHIQPVVSRHEGERYGNTPHLDYIVQGSLCVWFLGDAEPNQDVEGKYSLPLPDVLIAPWFFAASEENWVTVSELAPKLLILTHLPEPERDTDGRRAAVETVLAAHPEQTAVIPELLEPVKFRKAPDGSLSWRLEEPASSAVRGSR